MITEADVVRAALDLEADYLDDLGKQDQAAAVRARIPVEPEVHQQVEVARTSSQVHSEDVGRVGEPIFVVAPPLGIAEPMAGEGFVATKSVPTWEEIVGSSHEPLAGTLRTKVLADEFIATSLADAYFSPDSILVPFGSRAQSFDSELFTTQFPSRHETSVSRWRAELEREWRVGHDERHFEPLSSAATGRPLSERLEMYRSVVFVLNLEAARSHGRDTRWARYLRVIQSAGSALDIPGPVISYVISFVSTRR